PPKGAYNSAVPVDKQNNYGFSIGGPIIIPHVYNGKNKTFFWLSMAWSRYNQTDTSFVSLPTAAEKAGNFNGVATIYDPATGLPFANDTIPSTRFSANSNLLLKYLPNPALPGYTNNQQSLRGVIPTRQSPWGFTIDHTISDTQSIHWAEWRDPEHSYATETGSRFPASNPLTSNTYNPDLATAFVVNYINTISPNLVMTAGASWLGVLNFQISGPQRTTQLAFPAAPGAPQVPGITFSGPLAPSDLGSPWIQSINRKLGWVVQNNWEWVHGKNTYDIGLELRRTYQDDNECQKCAGTFGFSNLETADPATLTGGNAFASFLLGDVDNANRTGSQEERLRNKDFSAYIQDAIKWNSRLTFNIGLRWDLMFPFTAVGNPIVYFDSKIPNPAADGLLGAAAKFGTCTGCAGITRAQLHWKHFSPRGGFSYMLSKNTVLQGGFSMNYLDGGAYEYGTSKVAVNYGNLLLGSFTRNSTGSTVPGFGNWDTTALPLPVATPFSPGLGVGTSSLNAFDPVNDGRAPYDLAWSMGIQRELPGQIFLDAAYTGNRANFLPGQLNPINQLSPAYLSQYGSLLGDSATSAGAVAAGIPIPYTNFLNDFGSSATVLQALRPYPQYSNIFNNFDDTGSALYNALQVTLQKRFSHGMSFLVSYSLSRMMSDTNSGFTSFANKSLNKTNQAAEWSIDNNDQTNMINIVATYELPFGKGRKF
ncbi:MAG: TonB-dependent receptor domain-containing protein, partial [Terriglobia bacterium]